MQSGRSRHGRRLALVACLVTVGATCACASTVRSARLRDGLSGSREGGAGTDRGRAARTCRKDQQSHELAKVSGVAFGVQCALNRKLAAALEIATGSLAHDPGCRRLFEELGQDGEKLLESARYRHANVLQEARVCSRADAFAVVGGRVTVLCRSFARLSDLDAATVILHEALHHAGLSEWPVDEQARRSHEISRLVAVRCRFTDGR